MSTVTYHAQPAIHQTRGTVPLAGTAYLYRVTRVLWPHEVEDALQSWLIAPSLHVCCGKSRLGDVRLDIDETTRPDIIADAARLPFVDGSFASVLCDPPYNGRMRWNHDVLAELSRVASKRIIFQHWFLPVDRLARWKKDHRFVCRAVYLWPPRTYFGRVQVICVADREEPIDAASTGQTDYRRQ